MVDSDIEFKPDDFWQLWSHNVPVVAGAYCYSTEALANDNDKRIVAGTWDIEFFKAHYTFPAYTLGQARSLANPLLEVDWLGLGFALVRTEVFAKIEYPWFNSELIVIDDLRDTTSEDVGWCRKVKTAGYKIMLDPAVKVGHQKNVTI
jgi:GT2 family glycosyltransferase